ncbi:DNA polymerase III subunit gamma/tau [soil metagenome]
MVGQEHVVRTLSNAVERDRVHHAYLFVGSRGTGKTSLAKILARSLNCIHGPTLKPCGECESCRAIAAGTSLDVMEMDAASNRSVDDIRDLRERVGYAPATGRTKVYILDEAHMLTREAWNAFLKTLEEPPPNTVFVLATTEAHKVMPTIVDRCQRFDFQRPSPEQIAAVVLRVATIEEIQIPDDAIAAVARSATGSFRDALGTLDQLVAYGGKEIETQDVLAVLGVADGELILAVADAIAAGDGKATLGVSERLSRSGRDPAQFGRDLLAHLRRLLVIRTAGEGVGDPFLSAGDPARMLEQAKAFTDLGLVRAIDSIAAASSAIREGDEPRMTMELALLKAARPQLDASREALLQRLERIEASLGGGTGEAPPSDIPSPSPSSPTPAHAPVTSEKVPSTEHRPTTPPDASGVGASEPEPDASADVQSPVPDAVVGGTPAPAPSAADPGPSVDGAAEAAPEPSVGGGIQGMDLDRLAGMWPAVVDQLRDSGSELLSHVLTAARPVAIDVEKAVFEVGFPASAGFNKRKAEASDARDRVFDAVRSIVGEGMRPVYVLLDREEHGGVEEISSDELIEKLKAEFDAEEFEGDLASGDAGGDVGGMDAGLDAGSGIDTGEAA